MAKREGPAGHPGGSFQGAAPGSVALSLVPPAALPLLDGDSASGALPSVAGEAPAQHLGPMGMTLLSWRAARVPRGCGSCHWGWHSSEGCSHREDGVTWLAPIRAGISSVGSTRLGGLGRARPQEPGSVRAGRSGLPLGQFGSAWLGHGSHPLHIRRFFQQQGEPDAPQSAALGWESRVSLRSMQELQAAAPRGAPLLQLLDKPPWFSCSHRCNTPGVSFPTAQAGSLWMLGWGL